MSSTLMQINTMSPKKKTTPVQSLVGIQHVKFNSECNLKLRVIAVVCRGEDWYVITDNHQERWVRLYKPNALQALLKGLRYLDTQNCMSSNNIIVVQGSRLVIREKCLLTRIPTALRSVPGIAQIKNRGICWFAAMVFVMLFSPVRKLFYEKANRKLQKHMTNVLSDPKRAERLRAFLYNTYALETVPDKIRIWTDKMGFHNSVFYLHTCKYRQFVCLHQTSSEYMEDS